MNEDLDDIAKARRGDLAAFERLVMRHQHGIRAFAAWNAPRCYTRASDNAPPTNPLLYIASHPARDLDIDLRSAGIPKNRGPREFVPFVNLAQQSIMENVFCLLGFSGDDPNFLYWTGWVRDNLKNSAPQIYLCGLLGLTPPRRKLLQDRNVVPIDLSPLFPVSAFPNTNVRHANATEWFLENLRAGEPPNLLSWPASSVQPHPSTIHGVPIPPCDANAIAITEQLIPDLQ